MERIAVFGDLHFGMKTGTRSDVAGPLLEKLRFAALYCEVNDIDKALFSGDFFENVNHYITASIMLEFVSILERFKWVGYVTGNHDFHVSMGLSWEDEPIGLLHAQTGNMQNIDTCPVKIEGFDLIGRSWRKKYDLGDGEDIECPEDLDPAKTIMLTHSYLVPEEKNVMDMYTNYESLQRPCKAYLVGHYHDSLGHLRYGDNHLLIMGSVIRNKVSETHAPHFYCLTLEEGEDIKIEEIDLPHKPIEVEFIDNQVDRTLVKLKKGISEFVDSLTVTREVMSREDFMGVLAPIAHKDVPEKASRVVAHIQSVLDEKLK